MVNDDAARIARLEAEVAALRQREAALVDEAEARDRALAEALEQQTATAEVLRVIATTPTDLTAVLQAIVESAARLCEAPSAMLQQVRERDGRLSARAATGVLGKNASARFGAEMFDRITGTEVSRGSVGGRAFVEHRTVHVHDLAVAAVEDFPAARSAQERLGHRTQLSVPLLLHGASIGVLSMHRMEVRPFTDRHIALLETFADQAVIAIENARLFGELEQRNREVTEALEQQTATAEILRVIATSPTDAQPVLDAIVSSGMRLSRSTTAYLGIREGEDFRVVAIAGSNPVSGALGRVRSLAKRQSTTQAMLQSRTIHIPDRSDPAMLAEYPDNVLVGAWASLTVPLIRGARPLARFCLPETS